MLCGIIPAMKRLIPILLILLTACTTAPLPVTVLPTPVQTTLVRGPYLQSVTPTSVIVAWETADPAPGVVAYGESAAGERVAADPEVTARHVVTLTGLTPYTLYHYQVFADVIPLGADSIPLSGDFTFRSAAGPDQSRFTFVLFGDTRTQHEVHRAVVERILTWQPDFAIHTGDLVEHGGEAAEWQTFFSIEQELLARTPFFPILGNHEGNSPLYFDLFYLPGNERWYSFDYGNAHFVCLQADNFADLSPESEQVRWLEADLVASDRLWKMAVFHVPAYSSLFREQNDPRTRQVLAPIPPTHRDASATGYTAGRHPYAAPPTHRDVPPADAVGAAPPCRPPTHRDASATGYTAGRHPYAAPPTHRDVPPADAVGAAPPCRPPTHRDASATGYTAGRHPYAAPPTHRDVPPADAVGAAPPCRPPTHRDASATGYQRATMVNVDEQGRPLRPAIVWLDQRRTRGAAAGGRPVGPGSSASPV
jgi:hypothetical protein